MTHKIFKVTLVAAALLAAASMGQAQTVPSGVNPADIGKPPVDSWLTYPGDWNGQRYSTLKQVNDSNVKNLAQAWLYRPDTSLTGAITDGNPDIPPPTTAAGGGGASLKSVPLLYNGNLYFTAPNHVWSVNARTGAQNWHFAWRANPIGNTIGNRGVGLWGDSLYFLTADNYMVALDRDTGKELWKQEIANVHQDFWTTSSPMVIKNHVIYGVGTDRYDFPASLESRDPVTGAIQWKWNVTPGPGEPGFDSWPDARSARNGGGTPWVPGTYDVEQNLYIFGTGNPQAVLDGRARKGDNLYTASIVAINPDTGKMKWAFQVSPHDTHDWDASVTPVQIDGVIAGKPRKLVAIADRNGYYFLLDRVTGKSIVTTPMVPDLNWSSGLRPSGQPNPNPAKAASPGGAFIQPSTGGVANWSPPAFNPQTGLFYTGVSQSASIFYLAYTGDDPRGWSATERSLGSTYGALEAIDYKTGKIVWKQETTRSPNPGSGLMGLLTTAGNLVFGHDGGGDFVAYDAKTGAPLWRSTSGNNSNAPITYMLDGKQYVVAALSGGLYAFALP